MQVQFLIDKQSAGADHVVGWTMLRPGASHERHPHRNRRVLHCAQGRARLIITEHGLEPAAKAMSCIRRATAGLVSATRQRCGAGVGWMGAGSITASGYGAVPEDVTCPQRNDLGASRAA
jgi:hypothetical protein